MTPPYYPRLILRQIVDIGYFSLPVVGLTALFTGMVLALQSYTGFSRFNAEGAVATVVVLSVTRELGPVIAGLMVAGPGRRRDGGRDRHDARHRADRRADHAVDRPAALSGAAAPAGRAGDPAVLVLVADIIGVFGGYLVGVYKLSFNPVNYLTQTEHYLETIDVVSGLVKAAVFGFIVALMGCYHGYHSRGGAEGVGQATTYAVVSASILILLFNYVLTAGVFRAMSDARGARRSRSAGCANRSAASACSTASTSPAAPARASSSSAARAPANRC